MMESARAEFNSLTSGVSLLNRGNHNRAESSESQGCFGRCVRVIVPAGVGAIVGVGIGLFTASDHINFSEFLYGDNKSDAEKNAIYAGFATGCGVIGGAIGEFCRRMCRAMR